MCNTYLSCEEVWGGVGTSSQAPVCAGATHGRPGAGRARFTEVFEQDNNKVR